MGILAEDFSSQQERHEDDQVKHSEQEEQQHQQQLLHDFQQDHQDQTEAESEEDGSVTAFPSPGADLHHNSSLNVNANGKTEDDEKVPGAVDLWGWEYPPKDGLYDPALEKDACGVGFIVSIEGVPSHKVCIYTECIACSVFYKYYHVTCNEWPTVFISILELHSCRGRLCHQPISYLPRLVFIFLSHSTPPLQCPI